MNIAARVGRSFADELKRPGTQVLLIAGALFLVGTAVELNQHWTDATRPLWVRALWLFSPVGIVLPLSPMTTWSRFGQRLLAFLGVYTVFLLVFLGLFQGWLRIPDWMSTCTWLILMMSEMGLLTWIAVRKFGKSAEERPLSEGGHACL